MGITHVLNIELNTELNEKSIRAIVKRAFEINCKLYATEDFTPFEDEEHLVPSAQEAAQIILKLYHEPNYYGPLLMKFNNTDLILSFNAKDSMCIVSLIPFTSRSEKEFSNGKSQRDFARYTSLLLKLTRDFQIINIEIKYI